MSDGIERFSNRVANYIKYRPDYPHEIVTYLKDKDVITHGSVIADIGCGPGISSRMFLENGYKVFGVEPNDAMRDAATRFLGQHENFTTVKGTSDASTLPHGSIDLIVAAQAFHWFNAAPTATEFRRILKPGGSVALIWNIRQLDTNPFLIEYEEFLLRRGRDYSSVRHENVTADALAAFLGGSYETATFPNSQLFDFHGLLGRVLSSSYMPDRGDPTFPVMSHELERLFAKHSQSGRIMVLYDTKIHHSRL